jgi:Uma2 family endonuclease
MTARELLHLQHDGVRYELIDGELKQMSPAGYEHDVVVMKLSGRLNQYVETHNLGLVSGAETGFMLSHNPDTVRAPDISFVRRERLPEPLPRGYFDGPPDLAVKVVSPGDTVYEVESKVAAWLAASARAVWVVTPPRRTVTLYRDTGPATLLGENDELTGEDVVPGFSCPVKAIFA